LTLPKGKALTRQGARGSEFVVVVEGSAEVRKNGHKINQLGAGDFLGEIALISGAARTASVTTTSETRILLLNDRSFKRLTKEIPSLQASVLKALSERLQADAL